MPRLDIVKYYGLQESGRKPVVLLV